MKVSLEKNHAPKSIAFKGFQPAKSDLGHLEYEFNYTFDDKNYDCYLELCTVEKDKQGNYANRRALKNLDTGETKHKLVCGANRFNLTGDFGLNSDTPFAYHYKLTPKNQPDVTLKYDVDAGDIIDFREGNVNTHNIYNIVVPNRTRGTKGGAAMLGVPDCYNAMYAFDKDGKVVPNLKYADAVKRTKHFSNKVGGSIAGLINDLRNGTLDQYSKIFLTPFGTDDSLTPHSYWGKNFYQMAHSLGNIDNYADFQKELFVRDKTLVSDAALCNEGLEGIHFQHILKWGKKSYAYNWFRADLDQGPFGLGVISKNKNFITHKVINSPYIYTQQSSGDVTWKKAPIWNGKGEQGNKYDPKSPTYIQIMDSQLIEGVEKDGNTKRLKDYAKSDTGNPYDKVTHNDTVILFSHEINPKTYHENIIRLNEYNNSRPEGQYISMGSYEASKILTKFENFKYEGKFEGGKEDWDANVDIAKLNYSSSNYNSKYMKEHIPIEKREAYKNMVEKYNNEVQDYAISSAKYWTQKTNNILNLYVAQNLPKVSSKDAESVMNLIHKQVADKKLPASVEFAFDKNVVENVLNGSYKLHGMDTVETFEDVTIANMMELPLDSIEFGDNIAGVFASPYLTKRATHPEEIGVSRFDLNKKGNPHLTDKYKNAYNKMNALYEREMSKFAQDILKKLDEQLTPEQRLYAGVNTSKYGKYVLPIIAPEIAKFAIVKGLFPDAEVKIKPDGGIAYDYDKLKTTSLQALEIYPTDPEDEALSLIARLRGRDIKLAGIPKISDKDRKILVDSLAKMLENTNLTSFKLAEMIVDRTQAGLDWRIDAAKDIMDKDSLLNGQTNFETSWQQVTKFWEKFAKSVYKENPNSYLVAELTSLGELYTKGAGRFSDKYFPQNFFDEGSSSKDIVKKFFRETGITSWAAYDSFFTDIPGIFSKSYEKYEDRGIFQGTKIYELLKKGGGDFLHIGPLDSILYSYNFVDNHDKPRALHMMALDSKLFYSNLNVNTRDAGLQDRDYIFGLKEKAFRVLNNRFFGYVDPETVHDYNFMKKSTKAIAMGDALNTGFGNALDILQKKGRIDENHRKYLYEAIAPSISDLANGNYLGKTFQAEAFGTRPFDITIETVIKQAKEKHGLEIDPALENTLKKTTFYSCIDPAISKLLGIMKFMAAVPGIPTMFAGDDIGSTGYEELTRNIYLQNRSVIHHEWLEDFDKLQLDNEGKPILRGAELEKEKKRIEAEDYTMDFIKAHKAEFDAVMGLRRRPELHALNDGAPTLLQLQGGELDDNGKKVEVKLPAILRHSTDGSMAVSIFNTAGVSHDYDKYNDPGKYPIRVGGINLDYDEKEETGLKAGLPAGTVFINANNGYEKFVVKQEGSHYYIAHEDGSDIVITDNTLNLYHVPLHVQEKINKFNALKASIKQPNEPKVNTFRKIKQMAADKTAFSGRSKQLYNPQYNFVSQPYAQPKKADTGSKLSLIST